HLVAGRTGPPVRPLPPVPAEGAAAAVETYSAAGRADPRRVLDALLEEQALDPGIRGGLERLLPTGRCTRVPADLLLPALHTLGLLVLAPLLQHGHGGVEKLDRGGLGLRRRPADDRAAGVTRQELRKLALHLFRADDDNARIAEPPQLPLELLAHGLQMVLGELVRTALETRLRPAAVVVAWGVVV